MEIIKPNLNETYQEYIKRLTPHRVFGPKCQMENTYIERHHIIPKCMGGRDNKANVIALLPEEHYYAHKLLALENPENNKLQYAWWNMCHKEDGDTKRFYDVSVEDYAEAKRRTSLITQEKNGIPVVELTTETIYPSAGEAGRIFEVSDSSISSCCKGRINSVKGYYFCYLSDYLSGNYIIKDTNRARKVIDLDTHKIYNSAIEVAEELGANVKEVRAVCRDSKKKNNIGYLKKSTMGHRFAYYEDFLTDNYTIRTVGHEGRKIMNVETGEIFLTASAVGEKFNVDPSSVLKVCNGKYKHTHGYKFVFYENECNEMDNQQPSLSN